MVKVYGAIGEILWGFVEPHICSPMAPYMFTYSPISFHPRPISFHLQREFRFPFIYLQARKRIVCLLFKDKQTNKPKTAGEKVERRWCIKLWTAATRPAWIG